MWSKRSSLSADHAPNRRRRIRPATLLSVLVLWFLYLAQFLPSWEPSEARGNAAALSLLIAIPASFVLFGGRRWRTAGYVILLLPFVLMMAVCIRLS